jgi:hypothetical protein
MIHGEPVDGQGTGDLTAKGSRRLRCATKSLNFRNLATHAWAYPAAATGNKVATVSGNPADWVADLVAFKPLYRIQPRHLLGKGSTRLHE